MGEWIDHRNRQMPVTPATIVLIQTATQGRDRAERGPRMRAEDCAWNLTPRNSARIVAYKVVG